MGVSAMTIDLGDRNDPHAQARAARQAPLLLHSLTVFAEVIGRLFDVTCPQTVIEVGVESGGASATYLDHGASTVFCIEPAPTEHMRHALAENPKLHLVEGFSPAILSDIPIGDVYVIDGDHNYATVRGELDWILANAPDAVVILHDLLWPWGRRDLYYSAAALDPADVHPNTADGPTVWHDETTPAGFVGLGHFTAAVHPGGERNGVLTAVEDALAADTTGTHELALIPAVFGLGIIFPTANEQQATKFRAALEPYHHSQLLSAMENNRIALYTRVLAMQYDIAAAADDRDDLVRQLHQHRADLDAREEDIHRLQRELAAARTTPAAATPGITRRARNKAARAARGIKLPSRAHR